MGGSPVIEPLTTNLEYQLRIALTVGELKNLHVGVGGGPASRGVAEVLAKSDIGDYTVFVLPTEEDAIRIVADSRRQAMKLDLGRYRSLLARPDSAFANLSFERALSETVIGHVDIPFTPLLAGKHEVAVLLVDPAGRPLDVYTAGVCVKQQCDRTTAQFSLPLQGNAEADSHLFLLLHEMSHTTKEGDLQANVYAILSHPDPLEGREYLAWSLRQNFNELRNLIAPVRDVLADDVNFKRIERAGLEIGNEIFNPPLRRSDIAYDEGFAQAAKARSLLRDSATKPGFAPTRLMVRISSSDPRARAEDTVPVIPIALLGFSPDQASKSVFLGESYSLAVLMPRKPLTAPTACPDEWRMYLPPEPVGATDTAAPGRTEDALETARRLIAADFRDWREVQLSVDREGMDVIREFLNEEVPASKLRSTVLGILGHQDKGNVYFDKNKGTISPVNIRRLFKEPSVAIIGACEVAMDDINRGSLIGRLIQHDVGAVITTTSKISGGLAATYMSCMRTVLNTHKNITVGDAHFYVTQCLWSEERGEPWNKKYRFHHSALKYQVYGNPQLRLCLPAGAATVTR